MPPDREGAPQAGGKRKNTEPGELRPPIPQTAVPGSAFTHYMTQASHRFDKVQGDNTRLRADNTRLRAHNAAITSSNATLRTDNTRLRADNADWASDVDTLTTNFRRAKVLNLRYYDLCVDGGVDLQVLDGVAPQVWALTPRSLHEEAGSESDEEAEESDEEAEEPDEEAEEPDKEAEELDKEAAFAVALFKHF